MMQGIGWSSKASPMPSPHQDGEDAMKLKSDGKGREYLEITAESKPSVVITSMTTAAYRAPKEGPICTVKEGSQIALWSPHGFAEALIIVHPDDAPRLVYFDGTEETLEMKDGAVVTPPIVEISPDFHMSVGVTESIPNEFEGITDWSERLIEVDRETFATLDKSITGIPVYSCVIDGKREVWPKPDNTVEWSEPQDPEKW
jgi:hypothetical protein